MKIIEAKVHGVIDYVVVVFLLASPTLFGMSELVSKITYGLGFVHLTLTMITDFPVGVFKVLPLKIHGLIELAVSIILVAFSFVMSFTGIDLYFYISFGVVVFVTWLLTEYK